MAKRKTTKKKSSSYQIGRSNKKLDKRKKALHPGKRVSKSGKVYYEHRRNRSDKNRKTKL